MFWCANDFRSGRGRVCQLLRERFSLRAGPGLPASERFPLRAGFGFANLSNQCISGDFRRFLSYPKSMARLVFVLGVCAWVLVRERVLPPGGWRSKDTL